MTRETGISSGLILAALLAAFTFLTLAIADCPWNAERICFENWTNTWSHR